MRLKKDMKLDAEKLKKFRESKAWSQAHLSEVSGISLRTIQRIESKGNASSESLMAISAIFEIEKTLLIDGAKMFNDDSLNTTNQLKLLPILVSIGIGIALGATSTYFLFVA